MTNKHEATEAWDGSLDGIDRLEQALAEARAEVERLRATLERVRDMAYRGLNQNDIYLAALEALAEDPTLTRHME